MLNVEEVRIYADKLSKGPVVLEFSEFERFNRVEIEMSRTMFACLELQIKKCIDALGIDRRKAKPEILVSEKVEGRAHLGRWREDEIL